jgi:hypothetical protein
MADKRLFRAEAVTIVFIVCLKISDTEIAYYTAPGKSSYQCSACTKLQKVSRRDDMPFKTQRSLSASDASKKILPPERQLILPSVCAKEALSVKTEMVRLNGQATMKLLNCFLQWLANRVTRSLN